jgi:phosphohistidine phosphatase
MAQQLWLLRHGDAEPHGVRPDAERKLTDRGEAQSRVAGAALAALHVSFDAVLTSPRVRARDTARLAAGPLGLEPIEHEPLSGGFDREDAMAVLAEYDEDATLLLVGHEPDLSQVVHDFSGGRVDVKKGGVVALRVARAAGDLIVLLRPRELELIV